MTGRHFAVSLLTAWPVLSFWVAGLFNNTWTWDVAMLPPLLLVALVALVWGVVVARERPHPKLDKAAVVCGGIGAVAGWFVLAAAAVFVAPPLGNMHVAIPNPLALLLVLPLGLATSWYCSRTVAEMLRRGPTLGVGASLVATGALTILFTFGFREESRARSIDYQSRRTMASEGCVSQRSCFDLGERTRKGDGVPKDPASAALIFDYGCEFTDGPCCEALGRLYETGEGVRKNLRQALREYNRGCFHKWGPACLREGILYDEGIGGAQDLWQARRAFSNGCPGATEACLRVARMWETGRGGEVDRKVAAHYFKLACDANDAAGCGHLKRLSGVN
jgi:hypothetical protein